MTAYAGECSFSFLVERAIDRDGNVYTEDEDCPDDVELRDIKLHVVGSSYYVPARTSGPWEEAVPSDGEDEIIEVVDENNKDWFHLLTPRELKEILIQISEQVCEEQTGSYTIFN